MHLPKNPQIRGPAQLYSPGGEDHGGKPAGTARGEWLGCGAVRPDSLPPPCPLPALTASLLVELALGPTDWEKAALPALDPE